MPVCRLRGAEEVPARPDGGVAPVQACRKTGAATSSTRSAMHHCDLDTRTDGAAGRTRSICTKNDASYRAALKTYHEDVKRLEEVREIIGRVPA